jgi:hypothetical protein
VQWEPLLALQRLRRQVQSWLQQLVQPPPLERF